QAGREGGRARDDQRRSPAPPASHPRGQRREDRGLCQQGGCLRGRVNVGVGGRVRGWDRAGGGRRGCVRLDQGAAERRPIARQEALEGGHHLVHRLGARGGVLLQHAPDQAIERGGDVGLQLR